MMYISSDAPEFEAIQQNDTSARIRLDISLDETEWEQELQAVPFNRHYTLAQVSNNNDEPAQANFTIELINKSQIKITGQELLPARTSVAIALHHDENAIHNFDYFLEDQIGIKKPVWLLGSYSLVPSLFVNGIAAGKIVAEIDSPNSKETRTIEYTLQDECVLMNLTSENTSGQNYRLKITNSFIFAEEMDFDIQELVEVALLPDDLYNIRIMIRPSGRVTCNCRRL